MKSIGLHGNGTTAAVATVTDETVLATSALAGNDEALGALLTRHQHAAYNLAFRLLGSEADAADAFQEACLLTVKALRRNGAPPRESERFRPWLMRVLTNVALQRLRHLPRLAHVSVEEVAGQLVDYEASDPINWLERREAQHKVLNALLVLPDRQRAALTLREYQNLTYEEIAATLGVSRSAVETLLFRARRSFRDAYAGVAAAQRPIGCADLAPLLSAMVDGELDGRAWSLVSTHLARCGPCRRELREFQRARRLHALIPLLAPPATWAGASPGEIALTAAASAGAAAAPTFFWTVPAKLAALLGAQEGGVVLAIALGAMVMAAEVPQGNSNGQVLSTEVETALSVSIESDTADPADSNGPMLQDSPSEHLNGPAQLAEHVQIVTMVGPAALDPDPQGPAPMPAE